jgi:hypothetical protein
MVVETKGKEEGGNSLSPTVAVHFTKDELDILTWLVKNHLMDVPWNAHEW